MVKVLFVAGIGEKYRNPKYKRELDRALMCSENPCTRFVDWNPIISRHDLPDDFSNTKEFQDLFKVYFNLAMQQELDHPEFSDPILRTLMRVTVQHIINDLYLYFSNQKLRRELKEQILLELDTHKPKILIVHGVGSVIVFEALSEIHLNVPFLITVGAPLALGMVQAEIRQYLKRENLTTPAGVLNWYNLFDPLDLLSVESAKEAYFGSFVEDVAVFNMDRPARNFYGPHSFPGYLKTRALRLIIGKNWI